MPASFSSASYSPDGLLASSEGLVSRQVTLLSGQVLLRGALLGKITASGKHVLSLSAAVDGSQTPDAILAEDTDATGADKVTIAYFAGQVNENKVVFGTAHTKDSVREGLRGKGLHLIAAKTAV